MKQKQLLLLAFLLAATVGTKAQVGIGTATPDASALLDLHSNNKGFLLTQVYLVSLTDATTITSPSTGLIIYNTNTSLGVGVYINTGTPAAPNWSSIQTFNSNTGVSIGKVVYNASSGDNTKVVSRGMFSFRIGGPSGASELQMKMNASPSSTINLYINEIEFGGNTNNISQHTYTTTVFTTANWSTYQSIGNGGDIYPGDDKIFYFGYPPTNSFYRITEVKQGVNPYTFSLIVEQF